jgi:hypothetical protein
MGNPRQHRNTARCFYETAKLPPWLSRNVDLNPPFDNKGAFRIRMHNPVGENMPINTANVGGNCFKHLTFNPAFLSVCCLLSLAACSSAVVYTDVPRTAAPYNEVPLSSNFPTSAQLQLQAAQHWANIADDTGKAIADLLSKESVCSPGVKPCKAVFINPSVVITEFSRTFHNQLITTMVTSGLNVSKVPESSIQIDIDVQPVSFVPNRPQYRHAGVAKELGPGVWALRDVMTVRQNEANDAPEDRNALHWLRTEFSAGPTPQMEIVVTVSASSRNRYLARATNVYYVTNGDKSLYDQKLCSLFQPCVVDKGQSVRTRVVAISGDCPLDKPCRDGEDGAKATKGKK